MCNVWTYDYFAIQVWDPFYDPGSTAALRAGWLAGCPAPMDYAWMAAVDSAFGTSLSGPIFF